jgi:hypothetical protein
MARRQIADWMGVDYYPHDVAFVRPVTLVRFHVSTLSEVTLATLCGKGHSIGCRLNRGDLIFDPFPGPSFVPSVDIAI